VVGARLGGELGGSERAGAPIAASIRAIARARIVLERRTCFLRLIGMIDACVHIDFLTRIIGTTGVGV
jgi:hypothetical protein